mmetsp:Transcript_3923/g.3852  ORF Transcript_3923/g.3852 Transcript_3923/m.3852 type:complete len:105 (+) Transcript_3923:128-442(+)
MSKKLREKLEGINQKQLRKSKSNSNQKHLFKNEKKLLMPNFKDIQKLEEEKEQRYAVKRGVQRKLSELSIPSIQLESVNNKTFVRDSQEHESHFYDGAITPVTL